MLYKFSLQRLSKNKNSDDDNDGLDELQRCDWVGFECINKTEMIG